MTTIVAYRTGETYTVDPRAPGANPVTLVAKHGIDLYSGADGALLASRPSFVCNVPIGLAMQLGWCWVDEQRADA